ncbi:GNAT family N-acetyltransferase [Sphingomonas xanthus]|uniref:GNAT family N-acetyltransferase n=1 Tax=Sphingomonas xanthus TaxID=2594473 RepID=A0A516ISA2_9SPHN|nr:GNAT family N-acetyltransferase [Sphingomonas xanthus]QDP19770.1 GNAT family N-acetyltransferase [Sphingomonas xanthus]
MSRVSYRIARTDDAQALAELGAATFTATFGHLYRAEDLAIFLQNHSPAAWRKELGDPAFEVKVAEAGGRMVGYAKLGPPHLPFEPRGEAAELRQLYVIEEMKGSGVAHELIRWVIERARVRHADHLYLSVFTDNHRARRFYEKLGFEAEGTYHFMVGDHADEDIVMRLQL